jgi:hypothetical protein
VINASVKVTCPECKISMKRELFTIKDHLSGLNEEKTQALAKTAAIQTADPWTLNCKGCSKALSFNLWKIWEKQKFVVSQFIRCKCNGCQGQPVERRVKLFEEPKVA